MRRLQLKILLQKLNELEEIKCLILEVKVTLQIDHAIHRSLGMIIKKVILGQSFPLN
jgi:hypothetical protein